MTQTRHVWLLPPLGVGDPRQGLVVGWRQREQPSSPPIWEAWVTYVDERGDGRVVTEWVPAMYLQPVESVAP